jgi:hypothetical protein
LKPADYIASLVRQFEEQRAGLSTSIQNTYDKIPSKSQKPDLQALRNFLSESIQYFSSATYIILDAFDECNEEGRKVLVDAILSFLPSHNRLHFFIATRPNSWTDFLASSCADHTQLIHVIVGKGAQSGDLKHFIDDKLSRELLREEERAFISQAIIDKAEGL